MLVNYAPFQGTSLCVGVNKQHSTEMQLLMYEYGFMATEPSAVWWLLTDPETGQKPHKHNLIEEVLVYPFLAWL